MASNACLTEKENQVRELFALENRLTFIKSKMRIRDKAILEMGILEKKLQKSQSETNEMQKVITNEQAFLSIYVYTMTIYLHLD
jgi:hypothetical protein